jgi:NADPH:quinone reductase-like Zn-dependent oxidoreductase
MSSPPLATAILTASTRCSISSRYVPGVFDGALRDGGRVASTNGAAGEGPGRTNVMAVPSDDNLRRLAALLDDATLRVHVHDTFELDRATDALLALTERVRGKLAITVR